MRIGVLTLPLHTNFGGILQAYALQTYLKKEGHEVVLFQKERYKKFSMLVRIKHGIHQVITGINKRTKPEYIDIQSFVKKKENEYKQCSQYTQSFIDKYISWIKLESLSDIDCNSFEAIVVGSDQVWRELYFTGMWETSISNAFLHFTKGWSIRRISYAPSFGLDNIEEYPSDKIAECSEMLHCFSAISVREKSGIEICKKNFGVDASVVIDPTMLLKAEDYLELIQDDVLSPGGMLTYVLDRTVDIDKLIQDIANQYKMEPFSVNSLVDNKEASIKDKIQPSVEQWLKGFRDAEFVITDSFHACVFSIIFNKPFIVIGNKERGMARFDSLLSMFNQQQRLVMPTDKIDESFIKNKPNVDLSSSRQKAMNFLKTALDG